jgi:hypothetical protein
LAGNFIAIAAGHPDIEYGDVGTERLDECECAFAVIGQCHLIPV